MDQAVRGGADRFTAEEWATLEAHGRSVGRVAGLLIGLVAIPLSFVLAGALGYSPAQHPWAVLPGVITIAPMVWMFAWYRGRKDLPSELREKSRRISRRTWWAGWVPFVVIALAVGLGWFLGLSGWPVFALVAGVLAFSLVWGRVTRRLYAPPSANPACRSPAQADRGAAADTL